MVFDIPRSNKTTNVSGGQLTETGDIQLNQKQVADLDKMLKAEKVSLRLEGKRYQDYELKPYNIEALNFILRFDVTQ